MAQLKKAKTREEAVSRIPKEFLPSYLSFSEEAQRSMERHYSTSRRNPPTLCWGCKNVYCTEEHDCLLNYDIPVEGSEYLRIVFEDYRDLPPDKPGCKPHRKRELVESVLVITCPEFDEVPEFFGGSREEFCKTVAKEFNTTYNKVIHKPRAYRIAHEAMKLYKKNNAQQLALLPPEEREHKLKAMAQKCLWDALEKVQRQLDKKREERLKRKQEKFLEAQKETGNSRTSAKEQQ